MVRRGMFSCEAISALPQPCRSKSTICCSRRLNRMVSSIYPPLSLVRQIPLWNTSFRRLLRSKLNKLAPGHISRPRSKTQVQLTWPEERSATRSERKINQRWALRFRKCRTGCIEIARTCIGKSGSQCPFWQPPPFARSELAGYSVENKRGNFTECSPLPGWNKCFPDRRSSLQ